MKMLVVILTTFVVLFTTSCAHNIILEKNKYASLKAGEKIIVPTDGYFISQEGMDHLVKLFELMQKRIDWCESK